MSGDLDGPEAGAAAQPLDELMLAMDVVDTLRRRQHLVERELSAEQRDAALLERMREIYARQGIAVSDHALAEGVKALKEERFVYRPPEPTIGVRLARIYVTRDRWLKPVLGALLVVVGLAVAYFLLVSKPAADRLAALPAALEAERRAIVAVAEVPAPEQTAARLAAEGAEALWAGDAGEAEQILRRLKGLKAALEREYELRIISRPGERSGVERTPDLNLSAKNYYIIVEPIGSDGSVLTLPVTSEEDGRTTSASVWGLRVDKDVYDRVAADKRDDGIIQDNRFGVKRRGYVEPEYRFGTTGAAITAW